MCGLRDRWPEVQEKAEVFGVSYDSPEALKRFKESQSLPFSLLSDSDKAAAKAYGVSGMITAARVTFVIAPDGKIQAVIEDVNTGDHATQILAAL